MAMVLRRIELVSMLIAVFAVAAIMIVVSLDALLRYGFNSPLQWATELVRYYLMVIGIYFVISATFASGDHVAITLFRGYIPSRILVWLDITWCLMTAAVFAGIAYGSWGNVSHALERIEVIPGYILWPSWLSHLPVPLGSALIALRLLHHSIVLAQHGADPDVGLDEDSAE